MATCSLTFPPQINLARLPTSMQPLRRLSEKLGVELYIKRDDLTGAALSGNKIRKLEFVLADALDRNADTVITCGGAQSNHCRATAIAAAMLGLDCRLLLRTEDPAKIRRQILTGCPDAREIGDRSEAIAAAVADLGAGDILLVAGKGHESGQVVGETVIPFDDTAELQRAVEAAGW